MEKVATDSSVRTKSFFIGVPVQNPVEVRNDMGEALGSAVVTFADGGLQVEFHLDRNRPETFDMEVNPERVKKEVRGLLDEDGLDLSITLHT